MFTWIDVFPIWVGGFLQISYFCFSQFPADTNFSVQKHKYKIKIKKISFDFFLFVKKNYKSYFWVFQIFKKILNTTLVYQVNANHLKVKKSNFYNFQYIWKIIKKSQNFFFLTNVLKFINQSVSHFHFLMKF